MRSETVREYTILYQYLLHLKEPTYIFLLQIFQHLSPSSWWEDYIGRILEDEKKENFRYLDIADLLNVMKVNWDAIFRYLDKTYFRFKYDNEYKLVNRIHRLRNIVAHANENEMSAFAFADGLSDLLDYAKLLHAPLGLCRKLETDLIKHSAELRKKTRPVNNDEELRKRLVGTIENRVLLKAKSCDTLATDIRLSIDRTVMRINSMRTAEEIVGFFNGAIQSERGRIVQTALRDNGLPGFQDIKEEINGIYAEADGTR